MAVLGSGCCSPCTSYKGARRAGLLHSSYLHFVRVLVARDARCHVGRLAMLPCYLAMFIALAVTTSGAVIPVPYLRKCIVRTTRVEGRRPKGLSSPSHFTDVLVRYRTLMNTGNVDLLPVFGELEPSAARVHSGKAPVS